MVEENVTERIIPTFQLTLPKDETPNWSLIADGVCSRVPCLKLLRADAILTDGSVLTRK